MRLVQLKHPTAGRKVAVVQEPALVLLQDATSIYDLALEALDTDRDFVSLVESRVSDSTLDYDMIYAGQSDWTLLPSFDCPDNSFSCLVSGTGLTHKNSALN